MKGGEPQATGAKSGVELKKDPVCGIYIPAGASVTRVIDGRTVYFCSEECRKKFG